MNTILAINLIATNPSVRSGRPYIVGTTLTVADIAIAKVFWMMEADAIADYYEISLPQAYAALAITTITKTRSMPASEIGVSSPLP